MFDFEDEGYKTMAQENAELLNEMIDRLQAWAATLPPLPEGFEYRFDFGPITHYLDVDSRLKVSATPQFKPGYPGNPIAGDG